MDTSYAHIYINIYTYMDSTNINGLVYGKIFTESSKPW